MIFVVFIDEQLKYCNVTYYVPEYLNLHHHRSKNIKSGIMLDLMKINTKYNSFISRK